MAEDYAAFDLRLRSLDLNRGEGIYLCSQCEGIAYWSVWLHTPEWSREGGATYVLCTGHALEAVTVEARTAPDGAARRTTASSAGTS